LKENEKKHKPDVGKIFLEELTGTGPGKNKKKTRNQTVLIAFLAIVTGLILGALFIMFTSVSVYNAFKISFGAGIVEAFSVVGRAYGGLLTGAFGDPYTVITALSSGNALAIRQAFRPITEGLVTSTPYIFAGLALALGFRAGVLNIGAEGQVFMGAILSTYIGYSITGLPAILHIPLALLGGAVGGAIWGFIPGYLKAKTGAHEVITCIMMNYIAFRLSDFLLMGPMKRPGTPNPVSPTIRPSAWLPKFFADPIRLHLGFFIALVVAALVYWLLFKTTWGFNFRTVGANPFAGKYAGINVTRNIMIAMAVSGALAGLAGANDVLGVNHSLSQSFSSGYGFDSIALALLGNSHPVGVIFAALLFGTLRSGAISMQLASGIPPDIISVIQAIILMFIAAPAIIRTIYRLKEPSKIEEEIARKEA
jgi:simple sugar transport system permease protein